MNEWDNLSGSGFVLLASASMIGGLSKVFKSVSKLKPAKSEFKSNLSGGFFVFTNIYRSQTVLANNIYICIHQPACKNTYITDFFVKTYVHIGRTNFVFFEVDKS